MVTLDFIIKVSRHKERKGNYLRIGTSNGCTHPKRVRPLLGTLTALALVRPTPEGAYAE